MKEKWDKLRYSDRVKEIFRALLEREQKRITSSEDQRKTPQSPK